MNCLRRQVLSKQETLLGRAARVECGRVRETERTAVPRGSVSGFMVIGLVTGLSLASHSELGSFLGTHASLSQDGFQRGGDTGRLVGPIDWSLISPFDLS